VWVWGLNFNPKPKYLQNRKRRENKGNG